MDDRGGTSSRAGAAVADTGPGTIDARGYGPMTAAVLDLLATMLRPDRTADRPDQ